MRGGAGVGGGRGGERILVAVRETDSAVWALMHLQRPCVVRARGRRSRGSSISSLQFAAGL